MTDRAEIERLLNKTGRTLEGLPTQDGYLDRKDYGDRLGGVMEAMETAGFMRGPVFVIHQSDVIELLVGALRDALDKPMQKPLTLEELAITTVGDEVWEERKIGNSIHFCRTSALVLACMCYQCDDDYYKYGKTVRAWNKLPTDEEREAAAWES